METDDLEQRLEDMSSRHLRQLIEIHQDNVDFGYLHVHSSRQLEFLDYHRDMIFHYRAELKRREDSEDDSRSNRKDKYQNT